MVLSPRSRTGTELLQNRFKVSYNHKLGAGSFARVYKGLDTHTNRQVAVKMYDLERHGEFGVEEAISCMRPSIEVMQSICRDAANLGRCLSADTLTASPKAPSHRSSFIASFIEEDVARSIEGTIEEARTVASHLDFAQCFVKMLGHSQDVAGHPGVDIESEKLFVITELGERSLADCLEGHYEHSTSFSPDELRRLQWDLVSIVCALHAVGFVHLDIKPCNIVRIGTVWKLIDFDGAVKTHTKVKLGRIIFTPWYMAPEIAAAFDPRCPSLNKRGEIQVSRLMDVWSAGLCALEAVFLQPILHPWYDEWLRSTGDEGKFMQWLSDYAQPLMDESMCTATCNIHPDMSMLLRRMLTKDPCQRACIAECLVHPWFNSIRNFTWKAADDVMRKAQQKKERREDFMVPRLSPLRVTYGSQNIAQAPSPTHIALLSPKQRVQPIPRPSAQPSPRQSAQLSPRQNTQLSPRLSAQLSPRLSAQLSPQPSAQLSPRLSAQLSPQPSAQLSPRQSVMSWWMSPRQSAQSLASPSRQSSSGKSSPSRLCVSM